MWFNENLEIYISLIPSITLCIFTIVISRKKTNRKEFWYFIKGGLILIIASAFISNFIFVFLIPVVFIFGYSDIVLLFLLILANLIPSIFLFQRILDSGNIYKLEENGLTYYENKKLEKLIKREEKRKVKGLGFKTDSELRYRIENERKETDIYMYSNGDEAVKIGMFYERMKKTYEHRYWQNHSLM